MRNISILLAVICVLSACSAVPNDHSKITLQEGYSRILSLIQPGMTRRNLYALLPPTHTPKGVISNLSGYSECHYLDDTYYIVVTYDTKNTFINQQLRQLRKNMPIDWTLRPPDVHIDI